MPLLLIADTYPGNATWVPAGEDGTTLISDSSASYGFTWANPRALSIVEITGTSYTVPGNIDLVLVNQTTDAAVTIQFPPGEEHQSGIINIKDKRGTSFTWNITITANGSETIDGSSSYVIKGNWASRQFVFYNGEWSIL